MGRLHLAGCGAVGQAAVVALAELLAADDDTIDVGNLQRYLLSRDADLETPKPQPIERALIDSQLKVKRFAHDRG